MSRRHRWAAVASAIGLLAAYGAVGSQGASAASSQVMSDPAGDATTHVDASNNTSVVANEPRADVVSASAAYQPGTIVLSLRTSQPVSPTADAASWQDSGVNWYLDTNGDRKFDYRIDWGSDSGSLYADVYNNAATPAVVCAGTPSLGQDGSYVVSITAKCVGNPTSFNWAGLMQFIKTDADDAVVDRFPDGDGNYWGPITVPGTTPPPTQPPAGGGGTTSPPTTAPRPIVSAPVSSNEGFWLLGADGGVFSFGTAKYYGSIGNIPLNKQIVGMAAKPDSSGYWFVASDGGIFAYKAPFWGSTGSVKLSRPIVGMASTPTGLGYWLVASDGGIFSFGDARFYGSTGNVRLNKPIVGMAPTPSGKGYWLVASDGGIFSFGDARFYGSTGNVNLNKPIVGMTATPSGNGYWFVASDGGVFTFGDAPFLGSAASDNPVPVVAMAATKAGLGYRVARADGSVVSFGNAGAGGGFLDGSLSAPVVAITTAF